MITRRDFVSIAGGSLAVSRTASAQQSSGKLAVYATIGPELWHWDADVAKATLARQGSVKLPADIQYVWPHANRRYLYVASSDNARDPGTKEHWLSALKIDPATGELSPHGDSVRLPARPVNVTTDIPSEFILVAFNIPSGVRTFEVSKDFTVGREIPQPDVTDGGIYAHQVRVAPDNKLVVLVTRGNNATPTKPEDPGALKTFDYNHGVLSNEASVAPNGGIGFGPRHLDFHRTRPWVYVSLERQSRLYTYRTVNGRLEPEAAFRKEALADVKNLGPRQVSGTIHIHPNGRFVYLANRNDGTVDFKGQKVFAGGENNIAVFSIDQNTGEPKAIQHADTHKVHARTFHIDPSGKLLVAAHIVPVNIRDGDNIRVAPAGMSVFRIGEDGKLSFERVYDAEVGKMQMYWMGMVRL